MMPVALLARQLFFEAVKVGDELPPLVKPPVDRLQIARYAGASLEFNPLCVDEQFARNSGFPSALAPGMLAMGFMAELAADWLRGARLRRFWSRFVKIVWPGDVITSRGRVVERRFEPGGAYLVEIEVWAENQRGELVVRGGVTAQLYYSAEDENRQRAGQPPLVVTPAEEEARAAKLSRGAPKRDASPARPAPAPARPPAPSPVREPATTPPAPAPARLAVRPAAPAPTPASAARKASPAPTVRQPVPALTVRQPAPAPAARKPAARKPEARPPAKAAKPAKPSKHLSARTPRRRAAAPHKKGKAPKLSSSRTAAHRPAGKKSSKKR
jgi:acyl dehydratase